MKVFMSWSGQRSKLTAELLFDWVKCVIQAAQPWISSRGIERGAQWFSEINNELKDTTVGVICLTQENKNAPWILFEAGALAKGLSSNRVCTFLVDLEPADLQPPLAQFNHTFPTRESVWSLVTTLNNGLEAARLDIPVLQRVFDTYWPQFEVAFTQIIDKNPPSTVTPPRDEKDILSEILSTTRGLERRLRNLEGSSMTVDHILPNDLMFNTAYWNALVHSPDIKVADAAAFVRMHVRDGGSLESALRTLSNLHGMSKKRLKEVEDFMVNEMYKDILGPSS